MVLNPDCVAVIGASGDPAKFGGRAMHFLVRHRYAGTIVPVNPGGGEILGIRAYRRIGDAPARVDVALIAVPARHVPVALAESGAAGVRCCVVLTAEFAETGAEGAEREAELTRIARRFGMRLIGPNCLGYINPHINLALTSSVALAVEPMPRGAIGLVSQSGSLMAAMISHASDLGTGVSAAITVGNQADLETCDFIEHFIDDATTRAICIYVEGLKDGRRFLELAERCRTAGKPLLAVKAGRSEAGAHIARSHTASLAGSQEVWEAACRDRAVCLLDDPESMIQCADFLVRFGAPRGEGVAALSPSGGTIAVTSDRIVAAGLQLAELTPGTRAELGKLFPAGRPLNPLDVGGLPRDQSMEGAMKAQELLARDPQVGVLLIVVATTPQLDEKVRRWGEAALALGKPTAILLTPGSLVDGARAALREIGCPFTNRMDDALRVIGTAVEYGRTLRVERETCGAPAFCSHVASFAARYAPGRLTELETKAMLRAAGLATTDDVIASSAEEAARAASTLGYPVALKAMCRDLVHKSDIGAVKLGLADAQAVTNAWREIHENIARSMPSARVDGIVVQRMAGGGIEMIVGTKWDPQFGAVAMVGTGGVWVELLEDVKLALAPVTASQALRLIRGLRAWPLLDGARGRPRADTAGLADTVSRVSWIAATLGPRLIELDVNPLLVGPEGGGTIALDGRAALSDQ
jgi:acetyl-CoA synthetase (ADP-forming)